MKVKSLAKNPILSQGQMWAEKKKKLMSSTVYSRTVTQDPIYSVEAHSLKLPFTAIKKKSHDVIPT